MKGGKKDILMNEQVLKVCCLLFCLPLSWDFMVLLLVSCLNILSYNKQISSFAILSTCRVYYMFKLCFFHSYGIILGQWWITDLVVRV